jgi:hypothetical protein
MDEWVISRNVERFERLLSTDLDAAGRATIMKLLNLERAKMLFLPRKGG